MWNNLKKTLLLTVMSLCMAGGIYMAVSQVSAADVRVDPMSNTITATGTMSSGQNTIDLTLAGTGSAGSSVSVNIDGVIFTGTADISGMWQIPVTVPGNGVYNVVVETTDKDGTRVSKYVLNVKYDIRDTSPAGTGSNTGAHTATGGDVKLPDYCPNGDRSGNPYDGTCEGRVPPFPVFNTGLDNPTCYDRRDATIIDQGNGMSQHFKSSQAVLYAYGLTMYNGTLDFRPASYITRQEAAKFFVQFAKNVLCRKPHMTYTNNFSDISGADATLLQSIKESYEYGIFKGDPQGTFRPKDVISTDELMAVMVRLILKSYLPEPQNSNRAVNYKDVSNDTIGWLLINARRDSVAEYVFDLYHQAYDYFPSGYVLTNASAIINSY